jgi:hypothetical protein
MILNDILSQVSSFLSHDNDDFTDRFHYRHTIIGLAVYMILLTSKQYYGEPIICIPTRESGAELKSYIQSTCWLNGTYRYNKDMSIENQKQSFHTKRITYYQWIILVVILQSFLFSIPSLLWSFVHRLKGFNMVYISRSVVQPAYTGYYSSENGWPKVQKMLQNVTDHLRLSLIKDKLPGGHKFIPNITSRTGFPLYFSFLFMKMLYIVVIFLQFLFLSKVFEFDYFYYGFKESFSVLFGRGYKFDNDHFPKRSLCNTFTFNGHGDVNHITVLCTLPMNLFHEIFYSAFWIWLVFLFVITISSIVYWLPLLNGFYRRKHVLSLMNLEFVENDKSWIGNGKTIVEERQIFSKNVVGNGIITDEENFNYFFRNVCSLDLILTVKLLAINTNPMVAKDLLTTLWYEYIGVEKVDANVQRRPLPEFHKPKINVSEIEEDNKQS